MMGRGLGGGGGSDAVASVSMVLRQNVASHNVYVTKRNITKRESF